MITLCIRYTFDHNARREFEDYVRELPAQIRRAGGEVVGYFLPTPFAGATTTALGLIAFSSLAAYEQYREALASDPDAQRTIARATAARCIVMEERSILRRADAR